MKMIADILTLLMFVASSAAITILAHIVWAGN